MCVSACLCMCLLNSAGLCRLVVCLWLRECHCVCVCLPVSACVCLCLPVSDCAACICVCVTVPFCVSLPLPFSLGYIRFDQKKLQHNVCHVDNLCKIVVHNILKIGNNRNSDYC